MYQKSRRVLSLEKEQVNAQIEWICKGIVQPSLSEYANRVISEEKRLD